MCAKLIMHSLRTQNSVHTFSRKLSLKTHFHSKTMANKKSINIIHNNNKLTTANDLNRCLSDDNGTEGKETSGSFCESQSSISHVDGAYQCQRQHKRIQSASRCLSSQPTTQSTIRRQTLPSQSQQARQTKRKAAMLFSRLRLFAALRNHQTIGSYLFSAMIMFYSLD